MNRLFSKKEILTIPNLLSLVRLLMIPAIVWLYCARQNYYAATVMIILSAATDIADGIIARKCNMVSDFGKILDPIADKCTQGALIICLLVKYPQMFWLVILFVVKEGVVALLGYITLKSKDSVDGAKWYGKLSTVVLYSAMVLLILFPELPKAVSDGAILLCACVMLLSFILYTRFYIKVLCEKN